MKRAVVIALFTAVLLSLPVGARERHRAVDLGLSVKWAEVNLPGHYAWGETAVKERYDQKTCIWYDEKGKNRRAKVGNDAATEQWGKGWRLPTREEWEELVTRCFWQWKGDGFTVTGPNGKSIFLPAGGFALTTALKHSGTGGYYWTSTPSKSRTFAVGACFAEEEGPEIHDDMFIYFGFSIRPVKE